MLCDLLFVCLLCGVCVCARARVSIYYGIMYQSCRVIAAFVLYLLFVKRMHETEY